MFNAERILSGESIYAIAFYLTALVVVGSALMVIWHKNPVISALYLALCFFSVAVIYALLKAHFLAAIQVLLYAGAILVLFLMIVMLLNLSDRELGPAKPTVGKGVGLAAAFGLILVTIAGVMGAQTRNMPLTATSRELACLLDALRVDRKEFAAVPAPLLVRLPERDYILIARDAMLSYDDPELRLRLKFPEGALADLTERDREVLAQKLIATLSTNEMVNLADLRGPDDMSTIDPGQLFEFIRSVALAKFKVVTEFGTTKTVGRLMFSRYLLPFEAASILLLAAIIGVIVLARRPAEETGASQ